MPTRKSGQQHNAVQAGAAIKGTPNQRKNAYTNDVTGG
jgi:hypothetical protein